MLRHRSASPLAWILVALAFASGASTTARAQALECPDEGTIRTLEDEAKTDQWCEAVLPGGAPRKHGPYRSWFPDGTLRLEGTYHRDTRTGTWRAFHPNGQLAGAFTYQDGVPEGTARMLYPDGSLKALGNHVAGRQHGVWSRYHRGSALETEEKFAHGVLNGPFRSFYPDGAPQQEGAYVDRKEDGVWTTWHASGEKAEEGLAREGMRQGDWAYHNEDGSLRASAEYEGGALIEMTPAPGRDAQPVPTGQQMIRRVPIR